MYLPDTVSLILIPTICASIVDILLMTAAWNSLSCAMMTLELVVCHILSGVSSSIRLSGMQMVGIGVKGANEQEVTV